MERDIVVMKFGGTSVADKRGRESLAARVRDAMNCGLTPVVVVSAMGRVGDPYATDTLLSLIDRRSCTPRETDVLMSVGETISSIIVANSLCADGLCATAVSGLSCGIFTTDDAGCARITEICTSHIDKLIAAGRIPVVAGFQGIDDEGDITTLGRGGSDTTACALGVALSARRVEIYKDVDGIMTADPKVCPDARVLDLISATELFEMSNAGARVVHAPAAELALQSGIPMSIRNTFTDAPGTRIVDIASYRPTAVATAISSMDGIARISVRLPHTEEDSASHMDVQTAVFDLMAQAGISIDMFTPVNDRLVFNIDESSLPAAEEGLSRANVEYAVRTGLSKVTVIGAGMHGVVGVMARVARALQSASIDILQSADSHATISVLVDSSDEQAAIRALHSEFGLDCAL